MFKVGQVAVYPAHGLVRIARIESKTIGGKLKQFYVLTVLESGMTIFVPTVDAKTTIRPLITKEKAREVVKYLTTAKVTVDPTTWNRRYREYMELIQTGNIDNLALVVLSLKTLQKTKDLSFGERKMLDCAGQQLHAEITLVLADETAIEVLA